MRVERKDLTLAELSSKLLMEAASFNLVFDEGIEDSVNIYVQYEHWNMGELKKSIKVKEFLIQPRRDTSLFVTLPVSTKFINAVVSTTYLKDGEFRGKLEFDILAREIHGDASAFCFLGKDQVRNLGKGDEILLGFALYGSAVSNEIYEGDPRRNEKNPLQIELEEFNKILVENNAENVEIIACRLFIEGREEGQGIEGGNP